MPPLSFVIVCCLLSGSLCEAKRVIFMPFLAPSHAHKHVDLARAVMEKGHEVWLVLSDTALAYGGANTTGMSIIQFHTTFSFEDGVVHDLIMNPFFSGSVLSWAKAVDRSNSISHEIMTNQSLFEEMKSVQADLFVFDDDLFFNKMFVVFPYRLGIPFACLDFSFQPFYRRVPFSPATVPAFLSGYSHNMTLVQRMMNTWAFFFQFMPSPLIYEDAVARYAPEMDYVPISMLSPRAEVWLIGLDPILQDPYPTLPNVKYIGGLSAKPGKPLDPEFQSFMDSGKDGVVVVSFGSMVVNMSHELTEKLMTAFLQLRPMKVVFRVNVTSPDPDSIMTSLWLPQNSLLAHENCRVFVSHCGINSQYEGMYHAVPMLGLPMFYDQFDVAENMVLKGFGISMDIRKVSSDDIVKGIRELLDNPRYRDSITTASNLFREQYGVPLQTAAYWLDHVMRYGGGYMRSSGQEMPLYQFLMVDVILILAGCLSVFLTIVCLCVCRLYSRFFSSGSRREKTD